MTDPRSEMINPMAPIGRHSPARPLAFAAFRFCRLRPGARRSRSSSDQQSSRCQDALGASASKTEQPDLSGPAELAHHGHRVGVKRTSVYQSDLIEKAKALQILSQIVAPPVYAPSSRISPAQNKTRN
jgi:hypothetical protein